MAVDGYSSPGKSCFIPLQTQRKLTFGMGVDVTLVDAVGEADLVRNRRSRGQPLLCGGASVVAVPVWSRYPARAPEASLIGRSSRRAAPGTPAVDGDEAVVPAAASPK